MAFSGRAHCDHKPSHAVGQIALAARCGHRYSPDPFLPIFWQQFRGIAMDNLPFGRTARCWPAVFVLLSMGFIGVCNLLAVFGFISNKEAENATISRLLCKTIAILCPPVP